MSLDRSDLSAAFGSSKRTPVDRAAGLTGLLPPPRPRPSTSPSSTEPSSTEPSTTAAEVQPAPVGPAEPELGPDGTGADTVPHPRTAGAASGALKPIRARGSGKPPVSATADTTANVAVYLEPDLLEQARDRRHRSQITYDELIVSAFDAISDQELQQRFDPARPAVTTGMPVRQRRSRGTGGIQIQLRLTGHQRDWLDQKQQALGAPSRSALVAAVLRLYLAA